MQCHAMPRHAILYDVSIGSSNPAFSMVDLHPTPKQTILQVSERTEQKERKKTRCFQARILVKENHAFLQCLGRGFKQGDIAGVVQRSQTEKCSAAQHRTGQDRTGQDCGPRGTCSRHWKYRWRRVHTAS
ncbi:predicted protein [Histoplasma capsulatum G186AR]|uniref:Uncharacterized protein n=1 Tax=Ajellomyces capsulatus (strain G186AR / H82 / ATCC MYA-2454 / RMSCC 2432) TaxID=447093 RepID=C0NY08_AJECG|nr:uncharacterized protein HCBG_07802 [Histoplasma capsulatum G186AR]EEH03676.1 predicted protein [Histoplasma capsulatum G186AR]